MSVSKTSRNASEDAAADNTHASRPLTLAENIIGTLKVLAGFGVLGAVLWAANLWLTAK